jgi:hypothetical protein
MRDSGRQPVWFLLANRSCPAFERSGHYPHFEEQALFGATVLEWLKGN